MNKTLYARTHGPNESKMPAPKKKSNFWRLLKFATTNSSYTKKNWTRTVSRNETRLKESCVLMNTQNSRFWWRLKRIQSDVKSLEHRNSNCWRLDAITGMKPVGIKNSCRRNLKFYNDKAKLIPKRLKSSELRRTVFTSFKIHANKARCLCLWALPSPDAQWLDAMIPSTWVLTQRLARIWFQMTITIT